MAHTHLQLSNGSASAILIKYGPGKKSCVVGWDRTTDTFVRTQCLRSKLTCPDLSPDGRYLAYYVNTQTGKEKSVRRVVSRWPWLKALAFWSTSSWIHGPGPGLFTGAGNKMWAGDGVKAEWDDIGLTITPDRPEEWQSFVKGGLLSFQLQRDGWKPVTPWEISPTEEAAGVANWSTPADVHRIVFQKQLPNNNNRWKLQLTHWCGLNDDEDRSSSFETFAMVSPSGVVESCEGWCSADFDAVKGRIVWTYDNVLYGAKVGRRGLRPATVLYDAREVKYLSTTAPY